MSVFYDHLVGLDEIHNELTEMDLSFKQHYELLNLIDSILHQEVLNVILIVLPLEHHDNFLQEFSARPHDSFHLDYLRDFDPAIEEKISQAAQEAKGKIRKVIVRIRK